jgi:polysaccharide deacetylase family protein (PEP-CTERM system associated)
MAETTSVQHAFSVDVEDYFHSEDPDRTAWDHHESRVERSTQMVLELCAATGVRGTFFVLGWVASRFPQLVRAIAAEGHEIASHGRDHEFVYRQTLAQFRDDVRDARSRLQDVTGSEVVGYRAPYFSIVADTAWAHEVLAEVGYRYSSSVFPGSNPRYGIPGFEQGPTVISTSSGRPIFEVPITTFASRLGCGGVYFRALPYPFFAAWIRELERRRRWAVFYIHPWELDPKKPRPHGSVGLRLRHAVGLRATQPRLRRLFGDFRFGTIASRLAAAVPEVAT